MKRGELIVAAVCVLILLTSNLVGWGEGDEPKTTNPRITSSQLAEKQAYSQELFDATSSVMGKQFTSLSVNTDLGAYLDVPRNEQLGEIWQSMLQAKRIVDQADTTKSYLAVNKQVLRLQSNALTVYGIYASVADSVKVSSELAAKADKLSECLQRKDE